jgi:hypothetical protein
MLEAVVIVVAIVDVAVGVPQIPALAFSFAMLARLGPLAGVVEDD